MSCPQIVSFPSESKVIISLRQHINTSLYFCQKRGTMAAADTAVIRGCLPPSVPSVHSIPLLFSTSSCSYCPSFSPLCSILFLLLAGPIHQRDVQISADATAPRHAATIDPRIDRNVRVRLRKYTTTASFRFDAVSNQSSKIFLRYSSWTLSSVILASFQSLQLSVQRSTQQTA